MGKLSEEQRAYALQKFQDESYDNSTSSKELIELFETWGVNFEQEVKDKGLWIKYLSIFDFDNLVAKSSELFNPEKTLEEISKEIKIYDYDYNVYDSVYEFLDKYNMIDDLNLRTSIKRLAYFEKNNEDPQKQFDYIFPEFSEEGEEEYD